MKPNPLPDLNGAPVYLPDIGEMILTPDKYRREIRWMAQQFCRLVETTEANENQKFREIDDAWDDGYKAGFSRGQKTP